MEKNIESDFLQNVFLNITKKRKEDFYFRFENYIPILVFRGKEYKGDEGSEEFCKDINNIVNKLNLTLNVMDKDINLDKDIITEEVNHYNKIYNIFEIKLDNYAILSKGKL